MTTKPFELDAREADAALRGADAAGRVVYLNSPSPVLSPDLAAIREWMRDIGRPVGCRAEVWCSYRERPDGSWYDDPARCPGGPLFRLGIYLVNDLVRLIGPVAAVQVMHTRLFTGRPTPDNALLALRFADGTLGSVYASFCVDDGQPYRNSLVIAGERGTIHRNVGVASPGRPLEGCRLSLAARAADGTIREEHATAAGTSGDYPWADFREAIRERRPPDAEFRGAVVAGVAVVEALRRAADSGATERVEDVPSA
jgi:predicted dehydrogenase